LLFSALGYNPEPSGFPSLFHFRTQNPCETVYSSLADQFVSANYTVTAHGDPEQPGRLVYAEIFPLDQAFGA
jgi:hypothetical protein